MPDGEPRLPPPVLTFGQKAVGLSFNPGGNLAVDVCKRTYAEAIDQLDELRQAAQKVGHHEIARLASVAITETQTAQMWAVKAVTWQF